MKRHRSIYQEDGVTLIELLAVITLLAIITTIVYSVGFQGLKSENTTSNTLLLNQEANIFINDLRAQYYDVEDNATDLCSNLNPGIKVNSNLTTIINGDKELHLTANGCIEEVNKKEPLELELTIINEENKELSIETIWYNVGNVAIMPPDDETDEPPVDDGKWIEMEGLPCLDNPKYKNKNIIWTGTKVEKNCDDYDGDSPEKHGTNKDLTIKDQQELKHNTYIKVGGDLKVKEQFDLKHDSKLIVHGNGIFEGKIHMKPDSNIIINGEAQFEEQIEIFNEARLEIVKKAYFQGKFTTKGQSEFEASSDVTFEGEVETLGSSKVLIKGNATFNEQTEVLGNSSMSIFKNAYFNDALSGENRICVDGKITPNKSIKKCSK